MKAGKGIVALAIVLSLSMLFAITSGCGKNVVGPTAPKLAAEADEMSEAEALQNYSAACHNPGRWIGPRGWVYGFLMNCTPVKILKMGDDISSGYFNDPVVLKAVKRITTSKLFYLIMFKHGAGFLLTDSATQVISTAWSPNQEDNPGNFPNKVTLFPFDWNTYKLFHGAMYPGWILNVGYILKMTSPEGNVMDLETSSFEGDIYQNNGNFSQFVYNFQCQLVNSHNAALRSRITFSGPSNSVFMNGRGTMMQEDGQTIVFDNLTFSTSDSSARCYIYSVPDNKITLLLEFNPDGSGTGYMDIKNVRGVSAHYDYSQAADGHGWWAKNSGKKHNF